MKNKLAIYLFIIGTLMALITVFIINYKKINAMYPNPNIIEVETDETLSIGGYDVSFINLEITSIDSLVSRYPESDYFKDQAQLITSGKIDVLLVKLRFYNPGIVEKDMAIYNTTIATDNTSNGLDLYAYNYLNVDNKDPIIRLAPGESIDIVMPYTLIKGYNRLNLELLFALYPDIIKMKIS